MPQWAVFITAYARLHLLQSAYDVGIENVIYGDTDSLTIRANHSTPLSIGNSYGQFKLEKKWKQFRAIAPKVYVGTLATSFKGKPAGYVMGAVKGLPERKMQFCKWWQLLQTGKTEVSYDTLSSLKTYMKRPTIGTSATARKSSNLENSLGWGADQNGRVWPRLLQAS